MLVAKLDFLQYIAVRSFSNNVGARLKELWRRRVNGATPAPARKDDKKQKQDVVEKKKVEPIGGRMPNASGQSALTHQVSNQLPVMSGNNCARNSI